MSRRVRDLLMQELGALRYEPTSKRVRASLGQDVAVDSQRAMLVWEPRRVVPAYAVPEEDIRADVTVGTAGSDQASPDSIGLRMPQLSEQPLLDPSIPFAVHTADGEAIDIRLAGETRSTASTFYPAHVMYGSSSTVRCSRSRLTLACCSRPCCRPATTCLVRTC